MAMFTWDNRFAVGIAAIDTEHQRLVATLNELFDAMMAGKGNDATSQVLDKLIGYTATHFATEEKLFDQHGYPQTAAHKQEHQELVKQVLAFQADFKAGKSTLSNELMQFLKQWLMTHILGSDKAYVPFLHSKGVK